MAAEALPTAPTIELPADALPADEIARRLNRSRRSLTRWSSSHPDELPKYTQTAPDGTTRVLFSWADVVSFCVNRQKALPPGTLTFTPDTELSDTVAAPGGQAGDHSASDRASDAMADAPGNVAATLADSPGQGVSDETTTLRVEVARLTALLEAAEDARTHAAESHRREVGLMEARLMEMSTRLEGLQTAHAREVEGLREELAARRGEAAEARASLESQRQREAALRWQTAAMKGERDRALAELRGWADAGVMRRLFGRPTLMLESGGEGEGTPDMGVLDVNEGEKQR